MFAFWEKKLQLHDDNSISISYSTKHLPQNGLLALLDGGGRRVYVLPQEQKAQQQQDNDDNKVFRQNHYSNMHKTVEQYKKQNVELQRQVEDLQLLVGERDAEVRDLAYKDLLPDQILRAQHALQALQDHLTEQHMRQLLGAEPLQAILGVICKKELLPQHQDKQHNNNPYYIQMIDSMDPTAVLQQEEKDKREEHTTGEESVQQRAKEILAAIQQRKQQDRRRRRFVAATTTVLACLSTVTTSLSHIVFTTLP